MSRQVDGMSEQKGCTSTELDSQFKQFHSRTETPSSQTDTVDSHKDR